MAETIFERQIMNKLEHMEKNINYLMEHIEDLRLSDDDKKAIDGALKEEKAGKLLSKGKVFG